MIFKIEGAQGRDYLSTRPKLQVSMLFLMLAMYNDILLMLPLAK